MEQGETLFTFKEATKYLKASRSTIYRLMWSGQLSGCKVGQTWRFRKSALDACIQPSEPPTMAWLAKEG